MEVKAVIQFFTSLLGQIKLFHWATMKYSKHKALDELHEKMSEKVDLFVESFIGRHKKQPLPDFTITTVASSDTKNIEKYLETKQGELDAMCKKLNKTPEFQNIIQDMMSLIDTAVYLCNLE